MKKLEVFYIKMIAFLMLFIMGGLTIASFLEDAYIQTDYAETIYYRPDSMIINAGFLLLTLFVLIKIYRNGSLKKISIPVLMIGVVVFSILVSCLWIFSANYVPRDDSAAVLSNVDAMICGDITSLMNIAGYLRKYQQQLGLCLLLEVIFKLFTGGQVRYQLIQGMNVLMIAGIFCGMHLITKELTKKKEIISLELIFSFGWFPLMFYAVFVYGVIPGLFLAIVGIWCMLKLLHTHRNIYGIGMALLLSAATILKSNFLIIMIGAGIVLSAKALTEKRWRYFLFIFLMIFSMIGMKKTINEIYEMRCDTELTEGMPTSAWIAMGMQEGPLAEGWYNGFNSTTYKDSGYSTKVTDEVSKKYIKERLAEFRATPAECVRFYYKKIVSQWNEATYESLWIAKNIRDNEHIAPEKIAVSVFEGKLHAVVEEIMNLYQLLIYFGTALYAWELRKKRDTKDTILMLCILGGFLFHILWEGKSQYIFPYVTLMLPCAASGYIYFADKWCQLDIWNKFYKVRENK